MSPTATLRGIEAGYGLEAVKYSRRKSPRFFEHEPVVEFKYFPAGQVGIEHGFIRKKSNQPFNFDALVKCVKVIDQQSTFGRV